MSALAREKDLPAGRQLRALREHWAFIVVCVLAAGGTAATYSHFATKRYQAGADILVTPVSANDEAFTGINVLRDSVDPTRTVVTAARILKQPEVARAVAQKLGLSEDPQKLLDSVNLQPISQANILRVAVDAPTAGGAADLANAFAKATIAEQTAEFQAQLSVVVARLKARLKTIPPAASASAEAFAIESRLAALSAMVGAENPNYRLSAVAIPPARPAWPRPFLSTVVALIAGLLVSVGAVLARDVLDPVIKGEDELMLDHELPILARVPRLRRRALRNYLRATAPLPGEALEAYRMLRRYLAAAGRGGHLPRSILVVSASAGEGKTMTSVNLAKAFGSGGGRVILLDADLRRPMVSTMLGVPARGVSLADLLLRGHLDPDGLVPYPANGQLLRTISGRPDDVHVLDMIERQDVERALERLGQEADVVVIDSPALTKVSDALAFARSVDVVLIAVRLGHTRRDKLAELRRILAQQGLRAAGVIVTTRDRPSREGSYYYAPATTRDAAEVARDPADSVVRLEVDAKDTLR